MKMQFRKVRWGEYDVAAVDLEHGGGRTRLLVTVDRRGFIRFFRILLTADGSGNVAVSGANFGDIGWLVPSEPLLTEFSDPQGVPVGLMFGLLQNGPDIDGAALGNWTLGEETQETDALDDDLAAQLRRLLGGGEDEPGA